MQRLARLTAVAAVLLAVGSAQTTAGPGNGNGNGPKTYINLQYSGDHERHRLDLYVPGGNGPFPLAIYIHGGGWLVGDKSDVWPHLDALKERGFAVASINHRMSFQAQFPAQIHDCKGAVRWLRAHASQYKLDAARFAAFGESSGGHLAALLGTSGGSFYLEGSVGGNHQFSSRAQVVGVVSGPTDLFIWADYHESDDREESRLIGKPLYTVYNNIGNPVYLTTVTVTNLANPIRHATPDDAPTILIHGRQDTVVPITHSRRLRKALAAVGVKAKLKALYNTGHEIYPAQLKPLYNFMKKQIALVADNADDDD